MTERPARADGAARDHRSLFERFGQAAHRQVSSPWFFSVCALGIVLWALSFPLWSSTTKWELALHTAGAIISLLLLALLENAGRRAEEAAQEKLNTIAEALGALMDSRAAEDPELTRHARRLREAVGLEERH